LASRDVGNDDEVLVNTYNVIVPHQGSNVNVWFGSPSTSSGQAHHRRFGDQIVAALADVFGVDNAAPMPWRAQVEQK
jgi:hypothetical protein